jgi:hypothetical protein
MSSVVSFLRKFTDTVFADWDISFEDSLFLS